MPFKVRPGGTTDSPAFPTPGRKAMKRNPVPERQLKHRRGGVPNFSRASGTSSHSSHTFPPVNWRAIFGGASGTDAPKHYDYPEQASPDDHPPHRRAGP